MSGLNAIEMSSLPRARRAYVYRGIEPGSDHDEPEGTGPAQGHGPGMAGTADARRGGSADGLVGSAGPAAPAQAGGARRCRSGAWPARPAVEPEVRGGVSPAGPGCL